MKDRRDAILKQQQCQGTVASDTTPFRYAKTKKLNTPDERGVTPKKVQNLGGQDTAC